jgi:hypothetical protein
LVLLPLEADEEIEILKHYFGITYEEEEWASSGA